VAKMEITGRRGSQAGNNGRQVFQHGGTES
jgi:hypothetical protein